MKPGKRAVRQALEEHGGVIARVADAFDVTRQTVYNWIDHYKLHEVKRQSRRMMRTIAEDNIFAGVMAGDVELSKFVVRYMPHEDDQRWASVSNVNATTSTIPLSENAVRILQELGLDTSEVAAEFEALIFQAHAQSLQEESA